jgi:hypothetical protein
MKRISFNPRFINEAGNDLIPGKIHTIRQNYEYWKKFEGKDLALFTWEGKPYQKGSTQKVFCVKRLVSVQMLYLRKVVSHLLSNEDGILAFLIDDKWIQLDSQLAENDGFINSDGIIDTDAFRKWFADYKLGKMAILHFTDFEY